MDETKKMHDDAPKVIDDLEPLGEVLVELRKLADALNRLEMVDAQDVLMKQIETLQRLVECPPAPKKLSADERRSLRAEGAPVSPRQLFP